MFHSRPPSRLSLRYVFAVLLAALLSIGTIPAIAAEIGSIEGTVTVPEGHSPASVTVRAFTASDHQAAAETKVADDGRYVLANLASGDYKLEFASGDEEIASQWYEASQSI